MIARLSFPSQKPLIGTIELSGSKSISNRVLIIQALSQQGFAIERLANAQDTQTLQKLLASYQSILDAGAAGTTFRFLTAYLSIQNRVTILTGSERMKQRPIGALVDALRRLGAHIDYLEKDGFPPLKIYPPCEQFGQNLPLEIEANISSQYITALLLIAPTLPNGLRLTLNGRIVSRSYIQMTLKIMSHFGIKYQWDGSEIIVPPQSYQPCPFKVESDWSAASYFYGLAAIAERADLQLNGLFRQSTQGDAVLPELMTHFGVKSEFNETGVRIVKTPTHQGLSPFSFDFLECPDIAQTLVVVCAALGVEGHFTGLETLKIKETDRINALQKELAKVGVVFEQLVDGSCIVRGKAELKGTPPVFSTYDDHRMAMSLSLFALFQPIKIKNPEVVKKSYPLFWEDLQGLEFELTSLLS